MTQICLGIAQYMHLYKITQQDLVCRLYPGCMGIKTVIYVADMFPFKRIRRITGQFK